MTKLRRRCGFTLIEVLIVVVIMAVLAATIIPQFSSSTKDAQTSTVNFNAQTLRSQIELFRANHLSTYPTIQSNGLPQLTGTTDVNGVIGTGPTFTYGPYVATIPTNPFNGLATVGPVPTAGTIPTTGNGTYGYQYDVTTGNIYPDHLTWVYTP
jgi:prepilin-type N-terminal cleavage/methylation domain-containing protein